MRKKTVKPEVLELAEILFMQSKEGGGHKFSLQQIADEIESKQGEKYNKTTVRNWSKQRREDGKSWEDKYNIALTMGVNLGEKFSASPATPPDDFLQQEIVQQTAEEFARAKRVVSASGETFAIFTETVEATIKRIVKENGGENGKEALTRIKDEIPESVFELLLKLHGAEIMRLEKLRGKRATASSRFVKAFQEMTEEELCEGWNPEEEWN